MKKVLYAVMFLSFVSASAQYAIVNDPDGYTYMRSAPQKDSEKIMTLKNASFDLFINGSNLLDEDARPQNSPLKYIAPLPGRAFQLGITMHI